MKNKLIFVGGVKGVGKTTLLTEVNKSLRLPILNTGNIYSNAVSKDLNSDFLIYEAILNHKGFVDSHYAGKKENGFKKNLSDKYLLNLSRYNIDLKFVLINLSFEEILNRRIKDNYNNVKMRSLDEFEICQEIRLNRLFFDEYINITGKDGIIINNADYNFNYNCELLKKYVRS